MNRRDFLKQSGIAAFALTVGTHAGTAYAGKSRVAGKKVIVIGVDGMDPLLSEKMMDAGELPNFDKLRKAGGYRRLGTTVPPLSPVAWASFIVGGNPGMHGIFDFIHRDPEKGCKVVDAMSRTIPGKAYAIGRHVFQYKSPKIELSRQGVPFWDYLDKDGISSAVYLLPSNYPPSLSTYSNHRSLSGMGTPDLMGSLGTYQYFTETGFIVKIKNDDGIHDKIVFKNDTAIVKMRGPIDSFLRKPIATEVEFQVHRDKKAGTAVVEVQGSTFLLKQGHWSGWIKVEYTFSTPPFVPVRKIYGICRFFLKEIKPVFRLYVSPINIDPSNPGVSISEPASFSRDLVKKLGSFATVGFQEAFKARNHNVLTDEEFADQADDVLEKRIKLLDYALDSYHDGMLFFYFSSTDMQSHFFWWDREGSHPVRSSWNTKKYNNRIKDLYMRFDNILADIQKQNNDATIIIMSDHGFASYKRRFNLNTWLRANKYIPYCTTLFPKETAIANSDFGQVSVDWSKTKAYGLGLNGLYINLKGREEHGIVGEHEKDDLIDELVAKLEAIKDVDGTQVVKKAYRGDRVYSGPAMKYAPDIIVGLNRGYKITNESSSGIMTKDMLSDNKQAWSADHCYAAELIPGVLFSNKPIVANEPSLVDLAPSILAEFGLSVPSSMEGKNIYST
jgi:predicted AlkP superfamily phosphohydrolase/phosphomutase